VKLCECGCGGLAPIAKMTNAKYGHIKGHPVRFIQFHQYNQWNAVLFVDRFWHSVDKNGPTIRPDLGPCWIWTGGRNMADGYGSIVYEGERVLTHRAAWFIETGEWPNPQALHRCDNKQCVRFSHLFEGTHQDNMADKVSKGRQYRGMPRDLFTGRFVGKI
jgi:hypothetical protein